MIKFLPLSNQHLTDVIRITRKCYRVDCKDLLLPVVLPSEHVVYVYEVVGSLGDSAGLTKGSVVLLQVSALTEHAHLRA